MAKDKSFTTYEEQIDILKKKKHIKFKFEDKAIGTLKDISYFALVNGYKSILKNPADNTYKENAYFEDMVSLYYFDEHLRSLLMRYILIIERKIKSLLSYCFSEKCGDRESAYLNRKNYMYEKKSNAVTIDKLRNTLKNKLEHGETDYIKHYRENYGNVPLWVLVNNLSLGNISKMFSVCNQGIQQKICNEFDIKSTKYLHNILKVLVKFRNVCAHNERLYNYKTRDSLSVMYIHDKMHLVESGYIKFGGNDVFSIVVIFACLLDSSYFCRFFNELKFYIDELNFTGDSTSKERVMNLMGFPDNWREMRNILGIVEIENFDTNGFSTFYSGTKINDNVFM